VTRRGRPPRAGALPAGSAVIAGGTVVICGREFRIGALYGMRSRAFKPRILLGYDPADPQPTGRVLTRSPGAKTVTCFSGRVGANRAGEPLEP
jgi:hypothetical protein